MRGPRSLAVALAVLVTAAPAVVAPALAAPIAPRAAATTADAVATAPKVVIVVGAVEANTARDRTDADKIYAEAIKYTPNVVRIYSPNATYAKVRDAAQGASIFIYLGHGYGFPSPYRPVLSTGVMDGMGLNEVGGISDSDKRYYGESYIANDFRFAKDAVVIMSHACYSAGSSEAGDPEPSIPVARQRVDNFASGWIKAGARAVIADSWTSSVIWTIAQIFTTNQTFESVWSNAPGAQGNDQPFIPVRNPQFQGHLDPDTPTSGFYRSIVGAMDLRTTDVVAGAAAASTAAATADTTAPALWSMDGPRELTPNADGDADTLWLLGRFSESVAWSADIKDADGNIVRSQTGSGHQTAITWDVKVGGITAPDGDYTWTVHATDAAGNATDASGPFTVASLPLPDTGVVSFAPTTPILTKSGSVNYALTFAAPVSGLTAGDFTRSGTSSGCVVGAPVGSGTDYTVALTGCGTGLVGFYLNAGTVIDVGLHAGPAGPIRATTVTVDATAPTATTPRPTLRTGLSLEGTSTAQRLLMSIGWTGSDAGVGVADYDVQRSYDGGAYLTIASATAATSQNWTMTPGHTYKFRVRARDKAGNVGAWTTAYSWSAALTQNTSTSVKYVGAWGTVSGASNSGGSVRIATTAGASASLAFSGRAIGLVTTLCAGCGAVQVWVDGVLAATVNTNAATTTYRQVVFTKGWSSYASHTIKLIVVGTPGTPRVELDAFEIIR